MLPGRHLCCPASIVLVHQSPLVLNWVPAMEMFGCSSLLFLWSCVTVFFYNISFLVVVVNVAVNLSFGNLPICQAGVLHSPSHREKKKGKEREEVKTTQNPDWTAWSERNNNNNKKCNLPLVVLNSACSVERCFRSQREWVGVGVQVFVTYTVQPEREN